MTKKEKSKMSNLKQTLSVGILKQRMLFLALFIPFLMISQARAQGYYQFLGNARQVPDEKSTTYGITYNTQGFDSPEVHNTTKMVKKGAPSYDVEAVQNFPGATNAFSQWIDDGFEQTRQEFVDCGGSLSVKGSNVSPKGVSITIEPTGFFVPELGYPVASVYYPATHQIRALNIYYTWSGANRGWLRNSKDLLKWELENYFATEAGIQPEPRTPKWPCDAPPAN
jgi:hypothetical protein